jgi:hypothetical protein
MVRRQKEEETVIHMPRREALEEPTLAKLHYEHLASRTVKKQISVV